MLTLKTVSSSELLTEYGITYLKIFNEIFEKEHGPDHFRNKYINKATTEESYHIIGLFNDQIISALSIIPYRYNIFFEKSVVGLVCDAFVHKDFRKNIMLLKEMFNTLSMHCLESYGIKYYISAPNEKATKYWKKICNWERCDEIKIQIIPYKIFGFNFRFAVIPIIYLSYSVFNFSRKTIKLPITLNEDDNFFNFRFQQNIAYSRLSDKVYYRIVHEGKFNVLYVFGLHHLSMLQRITVLKKLYSFNLPAHLICIGSNKQIFPFIQIPKKIYNRNHEILFVNMNEDSNIHITPKTLFFSLSNIDNR